MPVLLRAKIEPPSQRVSVIARDQLLDALDSGHDRQVTLVRAQPGYGKTTLLAQWRQRLLANRARVGWLTVDQYDADPLHFLEAMRAALGGGLTAPSDLSSFSPVAALELLLADVERLDQRLVLILDDADRASGEQLTPLIRLLINSMPIGMRLVMACRHEAALGLSSLNARGQLLVLSEAQLRFSEQEARRLLPAFASDEMVRLIYARTEGWPVALQLARLWVQKDGRDFGEIVRFTGASSELADYLTEQIFRQLPASHQELLLELSLLDSFNGDTISRMSGRGDGWTVLEELIGQGLLIVPIDSEETTFRFHTMFGEFLRSRLAHRGEAQLRRLHRMASDWYVDRGRIIEAIQHARRAGDVERTAELLERAGGVRLWVSGPEPASQRSSRLRSALELIDPLVAARHPRIELAQALLCLKSGDLTRARALYACARESSDDFRRDRPNGDDTAVRADALLVMGNLVVTGGDAPPEHLDRDLTTLARDAAASHPLLSAYAWTTLCVTEYQRGRFAAAQRALDGAAQMFRRIDARFGEVYVHIHQSQLQRAQGRALAAVRSLRAASELAALFSGGDAGLDRIIAIMLGEALNDVGDVEAARNAATGAGGTEPPPESWFDTYVAMLDLEARRAFNESGLAGVRAVVERARGLATARGIPALSLVIEACEMEYAAVAGQIDLAGSHPAAMTARAKLPWESWRERQWTVTALTHFAIASGRPQSAQELVEAFMGESAAAERAAASIQAHTLLSLVFASAGHQARAEALLRRAMEKAVDGGFVRPFVVAGPELKGVMRRMLGRIAETSGVRPEIAEFAGDILRKLTARPGAQIAFSAREEEVLRKVLEGKSNKEIAQALSIAENTVKFHLKRIFVKLDVHGRRNVIREHERRGLLSRR